MFLDEFGHGMFLKVGVEFLERGGDLLVLRAVQVELALVRLVQLATKRDGHSIVLVEEFHSKHLVELLVELAQLSRRFEFASYEILQVHHSTRQYTSIKHLFLSQQMHAKTKERENEVIYSIS